MTFPEAVADAMPSDNEMVVGTVAAANPLTVTVRGTDMQVSYLNNSQDLVLGGFQVGETVVLMREESTWLVLGQPLPATTFIQPRVQASTEFVTFTALTSFTQVVTFNNPWVAAPAVSCNIASGAGSTSQWHARAISVTNLGFTLFVFGPSATWAAVPVQWQAQAQTQ